MRRHDVPAQHVVFDAELTESAADDRRGRLGWAGPGQLAFRREGDAAYPRAAVPRRLADEQQPSTFVGCQVNGEATPQQAGAGPVAIEVECGADVRSGQLLDEAHGPHSDGRRAGTPRDRARDRGLARPGTRIARIRAV